MKVWMYLRLVIGLLFRKRLHFILLTTIHRFKVDFSVFCSICLKSGNMKPLVAKWPFCFKDIFIYIYIYMPAWYHTFMQKMYLVLFSLFRTPVDYRSSPCLAQTPQPCVLPLGSPQRASPTQVITDVVTLQMYQYCSNVGDVILQLMICNNYTHENTLNGRMTNIPWTTWVRHQSGVFAFHCRRK